MPLTRRPRSNRHFLFRFAVAVGALVLIPAASFTMDKPDPSAIIAAIKDPVIRAGVDAAVNKNMIPSAAEIYYPGYFHINADGGSYSASGATWPGLDSWQMAGAYLLLGRTRLVLDYFEFVKASQRKDGAIPFAIFSGDTRPGGYLKGLKYPEDLFTYTPPKRDGVPATAQQPRQWIGLFVHWLEKEDGLGALAPSCYVLTAAEIYDKTKSKPWLKDHLASVQAAAKYLLTKKSPNGLISGSGFYVELPPRYKWDGVTQCYVVHTFRELARLCAAVGEKGAQTAWSKEADDLQKAFVAAFWRSDHFGEYVHPDHGLVDSHGLTDVNWAAIAFGIADRSQTRKLWPLLLKERALWAGDMPTENVANPFNNEEWEYNADVGWEVPRVNDLAAMGRVWFLEAMACKRMGDRERLIESVRKVCQAAQDGYWRERYHPNKDGTVTPAGAEKYCEYPAIVVRVVFGSPDWFTK